MFIAIVAAIVTLVGAAGLVISAFFPMSDLLFNAAGVFLVGGPLIFFGFVIIGLCIEFASTNRPSEVRVFARSPSPYAPVAPPSGFPFDEGLPEGLRRERKGPMNPGSGRATRS